MPNADANISSSLDEPRPNVQTTQRLSYQWGLWAKDILSILFGIIIGVGIGYLMWGRAEAPRTAEVTAPISQTAVPGVDREAVWKQMETVKRAIVSDGYNPPLGDPNAPVTIVEFSDYQCPFCQKFHNETLPLIRQMYGDKVRFVYRDFPLSQIHSFSVMASTAAKCAGDQGKYWEYGDALFVNGVPSDATGFGNLAKLLRLDVSAFNQCLSSQKYNAIIQKDQDEGISLGAQSTPSFFINGVAVIGAQPFAAFEAVIDYELAHPSQTGQK